MIERWTLPLLALVPLMGCAKSTGTVSDASPGTPAAAVAELAPGSPAPAFSLSTHDGKTLVLSELVGKPIVLYFYPKDETPGCTKQACALRDAWDSLAKTGVVLVGISSDSLDSHKKFADKHKLPFSLASDESGQLAAKFGVPVRLGMTARQSIVIDKAGKIARIYRDVDVATHATTILEDLKKL